MAVVLVVVVLAIVGGVVFAVMSKKKGEAPDPGPNVDIGERLSATAANPVNRQPLPEERITPKAEPVVARPAEPEPEPTVEAPAVVAFPEPEPEPELAEADDDEPDLSRFGVPTAKPKAVDIKWPTPAPAAAVRHLEVQPEAEPVVEPEPVAEVEPEPEPVVEPELEPVAVVEPEPETVIDLVEPVAEPDPVDQVLNALISRARERQVAVADVAAELVEQAELEDREVDEVLADLVGRNDEDEDDADARLTLFSESVPRRPGELTQFSELPASQKKRVIIRVLCLLVAQAEESGRLAGPLADDGEESAAPAPSEAAEAAEASWPLARAVWPGATPEAPADAEPVLPARR